MKSESLCTTSTIGWGPLLCIVILCKLYCMAAACTSSTDTVPNDVEISAFFESLHKS